MDVDSSFNIIVGGQVRDNALITPATGDQPLAIYFGSDGKVKWSKYFATTG